jgi:hypothetical protein
LDDEDQYEAIKDEGIHDPSDLFIYEEDAIDEIRKNLSTGK